MAARDWNVCWKCESLAPLDTDRCTECGVKLVRDAIDGVSVWLREDLEPALLRGVTSGLRRTFGLPVIVQPGFVFDGPAARPPSRTLSADSFLTQLCRRRGGAVVALGLTERNITCRGLSFVFGLGGLDDSAVVSLYQLRENGRAPTSLVVQRALNLAIHELGHAFGLDHCEFEDPARCVMYGDVEVDSLEIVDQATNRFCRRCARQIGMG